MNIAKEVLTLIQESEEGELTGTLSAHIEALGFEGISVVDFVESEEDETTTIIFADEENELMAVFFKDEEGLPVVTVVVSPEELEQDEIEVLELSEYKPPLRENGLIDFSQPLDWMTEEMVENLLTFGSIEERSVTVIRKGKKVRKKLKRKIRKKRLSAKRKLAIKRGVRKRKVKKVQIQRKRKRSLAIRKRAKLKKRPKNLRVVG